MTVKGKCKSEFREGGKFKSPTEIMFFVFLSMALLSSLNNRRLNSVRSSFIWFAESHSLRLDTTEMQAAEVAGLFLLNTDTPYHKDLQDNSV